MSTAPNAFRTEGVFAARLIPWLPAQFSVSSLGCVSRSASAAVRAAYEVTAAPGEDLRALILERLPDFGTVRVPPEGATFSGALREPLRRNVRIASALVRGRKRVKPRAAPIDLLHGSLYGHVEFICERFCLDGLRLRGATSIDECARSNSSSKDESEWSLLGSLPLRLSVDGAVVTCRNCVFEAELTITPPKCTTGRAQTSLIERCIWSCSPCQGLIIAGMRPGQHSDWAEQTDDPNWEEAFAAAGLTALHRFAGELDTGSGRAVVVPNGMRFCVVRDCEAFNVRQHALFLRWDVCVLIERCSLYGKVLIEDAPIVELRQNPHLFLNGEQLDPGFIGTLRGGQLDELTLPARQGRRSSSKKSTRSRTAVAAGAAIVSQGSQNAASRRGGRQRSTSVTWAPGGGAPRRNTMG